MASPTRPANTSFCIPIRQNKEDDIYSTLIKVNNDLTAKIW